MGLKCAPSPQRVVVLEEHVLEAIKEFPVMRLGYSSFLNQEFQIRNLGTFFVPASFYSLEVPKIPGETKKAGTTDLRLLSDSETHTG